MAWRCSGTTNNELVDRLAAHKLASPRVAAALRAVDRANFSPTRPYDDAPQPIGHGATISAPHMHAHAAEHLLPVLKPGSRVLDVGSGSGYLTAILYHLVQPNGTVVAVEHIPELVQQSLQNLRKDGLGYALDDGSIRVVVADGRRGYPSAAPYDAIHVGAAASRLPRALVRQLASPGAIFVPVERSGWDGTADLVSLSSDISTQPGVRPASQYEVEEDFDDVRGPSEGQTIIHLKKDEQGRVDAEDVMDVLYVPLTDADKQRKGSLW